MSGIAKYTDGDGYTYDVAYSIDSLGPVGENPSRLPPKLTALTLPVTASVVATNTTVGREAPAIALTMSFVALFKANRPICRINFGSMLAPLDAITTSRGKFCMVPIWTGDLAGSTGSGGSYNQTHSDLVGADTVMDRVPVASASKAKAELNRADGFALWAGLTVNNITGGSAGSTVTCPIDGAVGGTAYFLTATPKFKC